MTNDNSAPVNANPEATQEQAGSSAAMAGYTATREGEGVDALLVGLSVIVRPALNGVIVQFGPNGAEWVSDSPEEAFRRARAYLSSGSV